MNKTLNKIEVEKFSRQIILKDIGLLGQKKIKKAKVLIIGAGGLGCSVAEFLVRAGVGKIGIIDNDMVNLSNIHRQSLYNVNDINKSKVKCVKDKLNETKDALLKACDEVDVILTAGGVSVGEEDHVRSAVDELGEIEFWKVAIKPGKPIAFGHIQGVPFVGLPGNPASVFVTFVILARPFLMSCQGAKKAKSPLVQAKALFNRAGESREVYLRGRLIADGKNLGVEIYPNQSSGVLSSVSWGDVLVKQNIDQDISFNDLLDVIVY